jgi:hypothetical protein
MMNSRQWRNQPDVISTGSEGLRWAAQQRNDGLGLMLQRGGVLDGG